jgi:signal transduction histidine kinase
MVLKISIVITIIFQIVAAIVSLRLTKRTKYTLSWVLITLGFGFLLIRQIMEALPLFVDFEPKDYSLLFIWFGVASSIFFAIGLILVRKIFDFMEKMEKEKRASEKRFLSVVIQAEEFERKRLAKDLHDGLGPLLSTVKMSVSALKKQENDSRSTEILNNLDNVIIESIKSIKEISNNLSPHILDNFGLNKAIRNFIQKINIAKSINIDFQTNLNDLRLEQNVETVLYRILCELINNTVKHANASKININLQYDLYAISLDYSDNGKGFDMDNLFKPYEKGMGFYNIFSRINSLKGKIETNSAPGKGTEIKIQIPFNDEK